ncbi:MAG: DUF3365 domain-containing protein [Deltaproteobacteria bacterium]|nr:DUF3365 domain-containing protein [Deltaproteobacteria bacterium]
MRITIKFKVGILMAIFISLIIVTKIATSWMNGNQEKYALIINVSGKQRMLTQKIKTETVSIARGMEFIEKQSSLANHVADNKTFLSEIYTATRGFDIYRYIAPFKDSADSIIKHVSLYPINPENTPNDYETKILKEMSSKKSPNDHFEYVSKEGKQHLYYIKPLTATTACLKCHGLGKKAPGLVKLNYPKASKTSFSKGEVIGAIVIHVPAYGTLTEKIFSLKKTSDLFQSTLKTFANGGILKNSNGTEVLLAPSKNPEIESNILEATALWAETSKHIKTLLDPSGSNLKKIVDAAGFIEVNTPKILNLMDLITVAYQSESESAVHSLDRLLLILIGFIIFIAFISLLYLNKNIVGPLETVKNFLLAISRGDISQEEIEVTRNDEVGEMYRSLNQVTRGLGSMTKNVSLATNEIKSFTLDIKEVTNELSTGSTAQASAIKKAIGSIERLDNSISHVASDTDNLYSTSEEVSSSVLEITASIDEVAKLSEDLSHTVEEVSSSITEMAYSVKEVTELASMLTSYTSETATAITQINASIKEVEHNLKTSANLSETTAADAAEGRDSVKKTTDAMENINVMVENFSDVIKRLADKSMSIGKILGVINEMSEQTNLLSLNAAIIAAQAGEHGKGFAVVADEIKEFSDRTAASTKQIEKLIKSVQSESEAASKSVDEVGRSVETGLVLSNQAGEALDKILSSASSSSEMIEQIAKASAEQLRGSQQVNESMERITEMLTKVYRAIEDQEKGSSYIAKAAERMMENATQARRATQEQSHGGQLISKGIENITTLISSINKSTKDQTVNSKSVLGIIENVSNTTEKNSLSFRAMRDATETLLEHSDKLFDIVKKFKK